MPIDFSSLFSSTGTTNPFTAGMTIGGDILSATGQFMSGQSHVLNAQEQLQADQFQATQDRQNANNVMGSAEVGVYDAQRSTKLAESNMIASAAAGGGSASDPSIVTALARTAGDGSFRAAAALYGGEQAARTLNLRADATVYSGELGVQNAKSIQGADDLGAISSLLKGGASGYSMFSKYGSNTPNAPDVSPGALGTNALAALP